MPNDLTANTNRLAVKITLHYLQRLPDKFNLAFSYVRFFSNYLLNSLY